MLFIRVCCVPADSQQYVHLASIHAAYLDWFKAGEFPPAKVASNKLLSSCLQEQGFGKRLVGGLTKAFGLALREVAA
jgi:uncharacterized protein (DUF3820 family)